MRTHYLRWVEAKPSAAASESRWALKAAKVITREGEESKSPMPSIDLPLEPREQAIFLLSAAAEIEHALMVQYLYAAYSLRIPPHQAPQGVNVAEWQAILAQIAREEMGHLITVQNLLRLLGGPLNFEREHSPYRSDLYPFRFRLEPVSLGSLAKYVTAERPEDISRLPKEKMKLVLQIEEEARLANDKIKVRQVGGIFADLISIFRDKLNKGDFRPDTAQYQAGNEDWGYEPQGRHLGEPLIVQRLSGEDLKHAALQALCAIAEQGEGFDVPADPEESHFERFLLLYQQLKEATKGNPWQPSWPLAVNPNTTGSREAPPASACPVTHAEEKRLSDSRITHPRSLAWAQLFNLRYRMLLNYLQHFLLLNDNRYDKSGDRTPRGLLLIWTFDEMRRVKKLAERLVQMPKDQPPQGINAGPPFELPYTLNLPDREIDRWRTHLDVSRRAGRHIRRQLIDKYPQDKKDPLLEDLLRLDEEARTYMEAMEAQEPLPPQPGNFKKVVRILEEAVRGFEIGYHQNFWRCLTRDEFLSPIPVVGQVIQKGQKPDESKLIQVLERDDARLRMPRGRPPVPPGRIQFIRNWIEKGCPDSHPPGEIGIVPEGKNCQEKENGPQNPRESMIELLKSKRGIAQAIHGGIQAAPSSLSQLFQQEKYQEILDFLQSADGQRPPVVGKPLIVKGKPQESGFVTQIKQGVMKGRFSDEEIQIVEGWIESLE